SDLGSNELPRNNNPSWGRGRCPYLRRYHRRLLQNAHGVRSFAHFPGSNGDSGISSAPRCGILNCLETTTHRGAADDVPTCDAIIELAAISSRSFPRVARGGRAADREARAVRDGTRPRPGRSIDAALAWV